MLFSRSFPPETGCMQNTPVLTSFIGGRRKKRGRERRWEVYITGSRLHGSTPVICSYKRPELRLEQWGGRQPRSAPCWTRCANTHSRSLTKSIIISPRTFAGITMAKKRFSCDIGVIWIPWAYESNVLEFMARLRGGGGSRVLFSIFCLRC